MNDGWYFTTDTALKNLADGQLVLLYSTRKHIILGFRRRGRWLTQYGTPVDEEIEQFCVFGQPKEK